MPRKLKTAAIPLLEGEENELIKKMNVLIDKHNEMDRRLGVIEQKLTDLEEKFNEEFGEDFAEDDEEKADDKE
ncbi:MAG: hypothetical protein V1835_01685 [Candidatus Micrarchaeota archaeon]